MIDGEKVLDGYDLRLASQIPYLHWADIFLNSYYGILLKEMMLKD